MCNIRQKLQEEYIKYHAEDTFATATAQIKAIEFIPENSIVLDIGCGNGTGKIIADKKGKKIKEYIGIDFHKDTLNKAKNNLDKFINADIENLAPDLFAQQYFDVIMFNDVIEHLVYPQKALKNLEQYLKDDGIFIMSIPNVSHQSVILNVLLNGLWYDDGVASKEHLRFFTFSEILNLLESINFNIVDNVIATTTELHPIMQNILLSVKSILNDDFDNRLRQSQVVQYVFKAKKGYNFNQNFSLEFIPNQIIKL